METVFRQEARDVLSADEKSMIHEILVEGLAKYNRVHAVKADSDEKAAAIKAVDQALGGPPIENAQAVMAQRKAAPRVQRDPDKRGANVAPAPAYDLSAEPNAAAAQAKMQDYKQNAWRKTPSRRDRRAMNNGGRR